MVTPTSSTQFLGSIPCHETSATREWPLHAALLENSHKNLAPVCLFAKHLRDSDAFLSEFCVEDLASVKSPVFATQNELCK